MLEFAIPNVVMPTVSRGDKIFVLVGPNDGSNAFRDVRRTASGDTGGGKVSESAPNVYDFIVGTVTE